MLTRWESCEELHHLAIAWVLANSVVSVALVGMRNPEGTRLAFVRFQRTPAKRVQLQFAPGLAELALSVVVTEPGPRTCPQCGSTRLHVIHRWCAGSLRQLPPFESASDMTACQPARTCVAVCPIPQSLETGTIPLRPGPVLRPCPASNPALLRPRSSFPPPRIPAQALAPSSSRPYCTVRTGDAAG